MCPIPGIVEVLMKGSYLGGKKLKGSYIERADSLIAEAKRSGDWEDVVNFLNQSKWALHPRVLGALADAPEYVRAHAEELNKKLPAFSPGLLKRKPKPEPQAAQAAYRQ